MKRIILLLFVVSLSAHAEGNLSLQIIPSGSGHDSDRLFSQSSEPSWQNQMDETVHIQWQQGGITAQAGLETQQVVDGESTAKGYLYELFYDFSLASLDLSVGKKQMPMGVGYAYRPLDMIQQEQRQTLRPVIVEGVPIVSVEKFTETGSVGLVYVNHIDWNKDHLKSANNEWAIKGYNLIGDYDLQWLLHHDEPRKSSAAIGFSWVGGDSTEFHGSVRIQGEYPGEPDFSYNPVSMQIVESETIKENGVASLIGMTWTHGNGISLMAEYWHDQMAASSDYWQSAIDDLDYLTGGGVVTLANAQQMLTLPYRFEYARSQANQKQDNLFLRLSYDSDTFDPSMDIFYHPDDGGYQMTLRAEKEISQNQKLSVAYRSYQGDKSSVFGNIGDNQQIMMMWEIYSATQ